MLAALRHVLPVHVGAGRVLRVVVVHSTKPVVRGHGLCVVVMAIAAVHRLVVAAALVTLRGVLLSAAVHDAGYVLLGAT